MREEPEQSDIDSFLLWADLVISHYGPNSLEAAELMRLAEHEHNRAQLRSNASPD
jgi:hypothetical protein